MSQIWSAPAISRDFYNRSPAKVARELLGMRIVRRFEDRLLMGIIVETEAYLGREDPAAHSFKGRTPRTEILFGAAGHAYIHSLRQYFCMDIVTEGLNQPSSVLIRALEPVEGLDVMRLRRSSESTVNLTSGPGKMCQALAIDRSLNGVDVTTPDSDLYVVSGDWIVSDGDIFQSPRVGITAGADINLRFGIVNNMHVSRPVRSR